MGQEVRNRQAYEKLTTALRRQAKGATVADIVAKTALPLETVRELLPAAADEYSARLEVTESGEIRYSFPRGFTSKYRGFRAGLGKAFRGIKKGLKTAGVWIFKVWIMVMLIGYFALFMLIALASLLLSVAASSSNSNGRSSHRGGGVGGLYLASSIFNTIIRIWFYSELLGTNRRYNGRQTPAKPKGKPLYKAIFDFVFGPGDPNARWDERENQAVIAYIQGNRGVISVPEFAALTGLTPGEAEERITGFCAAFGGSPEATDDGTVVYRFDDLLRRSDSRNRSFPDLSGPIKRLRAFSSIPKKANAWFALIIGANLVFGGYFLYNALNIGANLTQTLSAQGQPAIALNLYNITYIMASQFIENPLPVITTGLGWVPIIFSAVFWLIPALRFFGNKQDNETIKLENFRKLGYGHIWRGPAKVNPRDFQAEAVECKPTNLAAAQGKIIKEIGAYAVPEVVVDETGATVYNFAELDREKRALAKYRDSLDGKAAELGGVVFDTERGEIISKT
jgi:hypothetical protein